jgi:pimeloyl-ACP methyl ester carboxylesterase
MSHTLAIGSKTLAYTKTGHGPAVVIVHGVGGHKEDWVQLAETLAPHHTVYAIDMLGFGGSSKTGEQITIDEQAAALVALMDDQHVKHADLVGNSVGGWVAATLAAEHPDRVSKLVLVDAAGFKAMFEGQLPVDFYPQDTAAMSKLLQYVRYAPETHTDAYAETALAASKATGDAQAAAAVGKGLFVSTRLEDVADKVTAPTLVIWGAEDKLFPPPVADLVCGHVKGSYKVMIDLAGHFPQLDNPEVFNRTVAEFLAG